MALGIGVVIPREHVIALQVEEACVSRLFLHSRICIIIFDSLVITVVPSISHSNNSSTSNMSFIPVEAMKYTSQYGLRYCYCDQIPNTTFWVTAISNLEISLARDNAKINLPNTIVITT
jgi:hypothetical protein